MSPGGRDFLRDTAAYRTRNVPFVQVVSTSYSMLQPIIGETFIQPIFQYVHADELVGLHPKVGEALGVNIKLGNVLEPQPLQQLVENVLEYGLHPVLEVQPHGQG